MKRELTSEEIELRASEKNVKRIAVENFLMTLPEHTTLAMDLRNLIMDAKLYRWNRATIDAIASGIRDAHKPETAPKPKTVEDECWLSHQCFVMTLGAAYVFIGRELDMAMPMLQDADIEVMYRPGEMKEFSTTEKIARIYASGQQPLRWKVEILVKVQKRTKKQD